TRLAGRWLMTAPSDPAGRRSAALTSGSRCREAWVGVAVPGKALVQHLDALPRTVALPYSVDPGWSRSKRDCFPRSELRPLPPFPEAMRSKRRTVSLSRSPRRSAWSRYARMRNSRCRGRGSGALRRNTVRHRARKLGRSTSRRRAISSSSSLPSTIIGSRLSARGGRLLRGLPSAGRHDPVEPLIAGFVGSELAAELPAHRAGEESADRARLPARHRHDGRNGRALGALKHGDDPRLLGASAGTGSRRSGGCLQSGTPAGPAAVGE